MAGRMTIWRISRGMHSLQALRPMASLKQLRIASPFCRAAPDIELYRQGLPATSNLLQYERFCQQKWMSTDISELPQVSDPDVKKALNLLFAINWSNIDDETEDVVEVALTKKSDDKVGQEVLANAWRAAEAVEKFSGTLIALRMELDDISGFSGENVKELPSLLRDAITAALTRYNNYLAAFGEVEAYLKKKVELELGTLLIHIRQRCSGLGPEWAYISLLGTSGLSGSYIEHRRI